METIRDYLELQSLFHLYIYIYMYTDSIETFTTFTVNRVRISHQEIESLLRSLRFSNKRRRNMTIFPDSNKLFNKTIPNYSRKSRNMISKTSPQHPCIFSRSRYTDSREGPRFQNGFFFPQGHHAWLKTPFPPFPPLPSPAVIEKAPLIKAWRSGHRRGSGVGGGDHDLTASKITRRSS